MVKFTRPIEITVLKTTISETHVNRCENVKVQTSKAILSVKRVDFVPETSNV